MKAIRIIAMIAALVLAGSVSAQVRTADVQFARGTSGADIPGRITGDEEVRYRLGASAGQQMRVDLATSNSSAYFNIFAPGDIPGQSQAMFIGPVSGTTYVGTLPENGTYTIQVFLNRNAARRGETADYRLSVSIGGSAAPAGDFADSLSGGPDWWQVTGVSGLLNVRSGPSTSNSVVTTVPAGTVFRNMGCTENNGRWCRIEEPSGRFTGWVAGRFLTESGGPGSVPVQPAPSGDFADGLSGGPDWWAVTGVSSGDTLNIRSGPSTSNSVVARVPNGYVMRNLGCVQRSQRWCEVEAPDGRFAGWAAARFLRESARPSSANVQPSNTNTRPGTPQGNVPSLFQRDTGEFEVAWSGGCQVLVSPSGRIITAGQACSSDQRARSVDAVERYRREQGDASSSSSSGAIPTPVGGMQAYCLGAAAGHFNTAVPLLETDRPLNLGNLYVVTGRFRNQTTRAFRCQFDSRGVFQGVFQ